MEAARSTFSSRVKSTSGPFHSVHQPSSLFAYWLASGVLVAARYPIVNAMVLTSALTPASVAVSLMFLTVLTSDMIDARKLWRRGNP